MHFARLFSHLFHPFWLTRLAFPARVLDQIEAAVTASERLHAGEIRFVVEGALDTLPLLRGMTARARALEVFSAQRVWDTEANNGVLIYLLLAEHDVEIVADCGLNDKVSPLQWQAICHEMETHFARREYLAGALLGIIRVEEILRRLYPPREQARNELPDRPLLG